MCTTIRPFAVPTVLAALALAPALPAQEEPAPREELPAAQDLRAGDDEKKRYFLIGPRAEQAPKAGYKLLLVLPGGDGSAEFKTFVQRIAAHATGEDWLTAQLTAPMWSEKQAETLVWPTRKVKAEGMAFATEDFAAAVVRDVAKRHPIDPEHVFVLAWSSGGPAAHAISLDPTIGVTGTFVAMSVWKPDNLPPLKPAKGHAYFVMHSPQDFIPIAMARRSVEDLAKHGAKAELLEYEGGHGWRGNVYGNLRQGLRWLEEHHAKADPKVAKELRAARR